MPKATPSQIVQEIDPRKASISITRIWTILAAKIAEYPRHPKQESIVSFSTFSEKVFIAIYLEVGSSKFNRKRQISWVEPKINPNLEGTATDAVHLRRQVQRRRHHQGHQGQAQGHRQERRHGPHQQSHRKR